MKSPQRVASLLCFLMFVVGSSQGYAQGNQDKQDQPSPTTVLAEEHAARGRQAYEARRYADAAREFEEAYKLDGQPSHLYNLAQAHRMAGNMMEAVQCYEGFLQRRPNTPNRADIERRISEMRTKMNASPEATNPGGTPARAPYPQGPAQAPGPIYPQTAQPGSAPGYPEGVVPGPGSAGVQPNGYPGPQSLPLVTQAAGDREHDGFFLRVQVGPGYSRVRIDELDATLSGIAGCIALAGGAALTRSLVIYGEVFSSGLRDPTLKARGSSGNRLVTAPGLEVTQAGIGAGAAYFFMPANFYVSGALSFAHLALSSEASSSSADASGAGVMLSAGKEWWVGSQFGVGVALQLYGAKLSGEDTGGDIDLVSTWGALVASATFN